MAGDRFIYFEECIPEPGHVGRVLVNFLGGCGTVTPREGVDNWWFIELPGKNSAPFAAIPGSKSFHQNMYEDNEPRYIEVVLQLDDRPSLDIMTRHGDPFTSGVAERLADEFARFYGGRRED